MTGRTQPVIGRGFSIPPDAFLHNLQHLPAYGRTLPLIGWHRPITGSVLLVIGRLLPITGRHYPKPGRVLLIIGRTQLMIGNYLPGRIIPF
jgi:hypothetical protein